MGERDTQSAAAGRVHDVMADNKTLVRQFFAEALSTGDADRFADLLTDDHVQHGPARYQEFVGVEACRDYSERLLTAFPDLEYRIGSVFTIGDHVMVKFTAHGTHTGPLELGDRVFEPTEREATWNGTAAYRVADGKIAETTLKTDRGALLGQLGIGFARDSTSA